MVVLHAQESILICRVYGKSRWTPNSCSPTISQGFPFRCQLVPHYSRNNHLKVLEHDVSQASRFTKRLSSSSLHNSRRGTRHTPRTFCAHASSDEDYRSSRNIAISIYRRYRNFVDRGGADNLKDFVDAAVNAYALGCTDEGIRKELLNLKESGFEIEMQKSYGGKSGLKCKICFEEVDECILWLSIVFITILCTPPPTVVRWSSTTPVSEEALLQWKGFCALIANAYYIKGMAWLPVKTLQLEQMAVVGQAEEPSVISSRMRLVFSTLEMVSPQWPRV